MSHSTAVNNSVLQYWQDTAFKEKLAVFSFDLKNAISLSSAELKNGLLSCVLPQNEGSTKKVWIAPFKIIKKGSPSDTFIPLWIPADLIGTQLQPSALCPLPWIPALFFDLQSEVGTLFENIEQYDKLLLDYFFDIQGQLIIHTQWKTYFSSCITLFQSLLKPAIERILDEHYIVSAHGFMIEALDEMPTLSSPLARGYSALETPPFEEYKTDVLLIKGHYPQTPALFPSVKIALMQLLSLKEGEMQALAIPPGTQKQELLQALVASIWSTAAEKSDFVPVIALVGATKPVLELPVCEFSQTLEYESLSQGMQILNNYVALKEKLKEKFGTVEAVDDILVAFQLEDQKLEIEFERYSDKYTKWQKEKPSGVWARLAVWLPHAKKRQEKVARAFFHELLLGSPAKVDSINAEQIIIEKMRKIKVARTKIHNELVDICQWVASKNGMQHRWSNWASQNISDKLQANIEDNLTWMGQSCGESLFKLACQAFKAPLLNICSIQQALQYPVEGLIDYLIIDNAHRISPAKILPLLNKAKIAIFLGDEKGFPLRALVSPLYDNCLLKSYDVAKTEEDLEDLAYRGIQANGSAFCIAKAMSRFKKMQPDGFEAYCELSLQEQTTIHPTIFQYSHAIYGRSIQVLAKGEKTESENRALPLGYIHIKGVKQAFELSFQNVKEAEILLDWLLNHSAHYANKRVSIITLFLAQKQYFAQRLLELDIPVSVYLLSETDNLIQDCILFSPVYTSADVKPYLLDQGEAFLHVVLTRAKESFMIFADMDIFNPHTHSPCGQMAKLLFQKEVSYV